jgi:hypothetical protein
LRFNSPACFGFVESFFDSRPEVFHVATVNTPGGAAGKHLDLHSGVAGAANKDKGEPWAMILRQVQGSEPAGIATAVTGIKEDEIRVTFFQSLQQACFRHATASAGDLLPGQLLHKVQCLHGIVMDDQDIQVFLHDLSPSC